MIVAESRNRIFVFRVIFAVLGITLAALPTMYPGSVAQVDSTAAERYVTLPQAPYEEFFGARIPRTMSLLALSNELKHYPVKILVFGQSTSGQLTRSPLEAIIRERFPHANITWQNSSIAGFEAGQLVRSAEHTLYPVYPDLVIFHDFGVMRPEFERMIENIRRFTTSEIFIWTHQVRGNGERGSEEFERGSPRDDSESERMMYLAQKYNCEIADVRQDWKAYLKEHSLAPKDLLTDNVHFNKHGLKVVANSIARHFRLNPAAPAGWMETVRSYEAKRLPDEGRADGISYTGKPWRFAGASATGDSRESALKMTFKGNRIDVIAGQVKNGKLGTARILIDGRRPSEIPELYRFTLPSKCHGAYWQPAIRRISSRAPLILEDWTLRITEISEDARKFTFEVVGAKTGYDGTGYFDAEKYQFEKYGNAFEYDGDEPYPDVFVSNSGRVVIDHRDFKISWAQAYTNEKCPAGFETTWSVVPHFVDTYEAPVIDDPSFVRQITLAQGLTNGTHTLEIIPNGDGLIPIEEIIVHEPPLK